MSVNIYDKTNDELKLVAGGTLYADSPVGSIVPYGGTSAPKGWLLCQGQAVSRNTYAELFEVIGTAFGTGNGSTTFNVPDLRETAPVGSGTRGDGVTSHDTYTVGQFKDDQLQNHTWCCRAGPASRRCSPGRRPRRRSSGRTARGSRCRWREPRRRCSP